MFLEVIHEKLSSSLKNKFNITPPLFSVGIAEIHFSEKSPIAEKNLIILAAKK
ncbi:MAG: hypothetical protein ACI865_000561 [Flavobacteriaceae bacterium]